MTWTYKAHVPAQRLTNPYSPLPFQAIRYRIYVLIISMIIAKPPLFNNRISRNICTKPQSLKSANLQFQLLFHML